MNRIITGLLSTLIVGGSVFTAIGQETNSLLWKISGKDLSKPSYLFGTIHMLPQEKYFFTDQMQGAFDQSEVLALEADMNIPLAEQMKMAMEMMMPDGKTWKDHLSEEDYAAVKTAFVDSLGVKEGKFEKQYIKIRPVYVSGLILTQLLGKVKMYEQELTKMAKKSKKPIMGLETIQEQLDIVNSISIEEQIEDLKGNSADIMTDYNKLLDAYVNQNLKELGQLAENEEGFDKMEAKLLTDRNNKWVKLIEKQATKNATFFAVGAMHLIGEKGLIKLLRESGYSVEAVKK